MSQRLRIGESITVVIRKGTVPFSSNENRDSPPLIHSPMLTRRTLLRTTAAAGAAICLPRMNLLAAGKSPNEKLNIAIVGCGGRGGENLPGVAGENIVALCDVNEHSAANAVRQFPKASKFQDYRKMLDAMQREIDAVVVSTPDHMHAPISLAAMRLGKHVYCEKPLTWSIEEARQMAEAATKYKVATQMGTQGMAEAGSRAGIEVLQSGVLGQVREMHGWSDRPVRFWPQGIDRPKETPPVPPGLNWDLWLGVAPERPYHPAYVPFKWRGWKDFGTGAIGDMGIHNLAMPFIGLNLGLPTSVEIVETSGLKQETFPAWSRLRFEFPQRGELAPLTLHWYDGGRLPARRLIGGRNVALNGAILVGEKGTLYSIEWTGGDWRLLPEEKFRGFQRPAQTVPRSPGHHAEWIAACKGGRAALCNFADFAARITETMLLGNLALRTGRKIEWDAAGMQAKNCPEAGPLIRREYRKGWKF
jgi:predicted dehydrogenase